MAASLTNMFEMQVICVTSFQLLGKLTRLSNFLVLFLPL